MYKITLGVDGMMCGMCEAHVNDAVRNNFKVKKVSSSHSSGKVEILAEEAFSEDSLKKIIDETGYTVTSYSCEEAKKKGLFGFLK